MQALVVRLSLLADSRSKSSAACRVTTAANDTVFVKFPCIVRAPGFDASGACKAGMPPKWESTPQQHLDAIQRVSDMCGFGGLKSRTWSAPVTTVTPEVSLCVHLLARSGVDKNVLHGT